ncbi:MAG TPA: hypothetical protein PKO33_00180 [Pyrinomonadaceae bacterium]|nr:hypothetical protein [Pyrinomonadaceae bacterium]
MNWRDIRPDNEVLEHAERIWRVESSFPSWFRSANLLWNADLDEFRAFLLDCAEIFALFDNAGRICALVYVESGGDPRRLTIHLSILERIPAAEFVAEAARLRSLLLRRGVTVIRGWIVRKNWILARILLGLGFLETDLTMTYGFAHGQGIRWKLFELRTL